MKGHAFYQLGNEEVHWRTILWPRNIRLSTLIFSKMFIGLNEISKGHWEEGYRHLESAIQSKDTDSTILPSLYAHAGNCLYKLGKKRKAGQYFKKSHEIDPEDVDSYLIEGRMYMEDGDFDKAVKKVGFSVRACTVCRYVE